MKQIFHPYEIWEDYKNGMYVLPSEADCPSRVVLSKKLLSTPSDLYLAALNMVNNWGISAEHNLSNRSRNRQAWLGQATCSHAHGATEAQTKAAWHQLFICQQDAANRVADEIIALWENCHG